MTQNITLAASCLLVALTIVPAHAQSLSCLTDALGTIRCADGSQFRPSAAGTARDQNGAPVVSILPGLAAQNSTQSGQQPPKYGLQNRNATDLLGRKTGYNGIPCSARNSTGAGCR